MNTNLKRILLPLALLCLLLTGCGGRAAQSDMTETSQSAADSQSAPEGETTPEGETPDSPADAGTWAMEIQVKDYGTIRAELDGKAAPLTVQNFVSLAESGFYDGLTFHRIMDGFMIQGGDPDGNGFGGADTNIPGEFPANGWDNPISHVRGTLSMARATDPNSASSQFFIVQQDSTFLDGNYAAFGTVTEGMDVVDAICSDISPLALDDNGTIAPEDQPVMEYVKVSPVENAA